MKRKDWKIKKSKKNIYGNFFKKYIKKKKRIFFLRKLFIRKNSLLFKKNLISNFNLYFKFLDNLHITKNSYIKIFFLKNINNYLSVLPNFLIKKRVFQDYYNYLNFINKNNLSCIFLPKLKNFYINSVGLNMIMYPKKINSGEGDSISLLLNEFKNSGDKELLNIKSSRNVINNQILNNLYDLSYFLNFNIFVINITEIYRIVIILNIHILIK